MPARRLRIATMRGIPVAISPSWLLVVASLTWLLGDRYYPSQVARIAPGEAYALGLGSVLLLALALLAHELAHAHVADSRGIAVERVELWLFGGMPRIGARPRRPGDELAYAIAGPAASAGLVALFGLASLALPAAAPAALRALILFGLAANGLILAVNLLPGLPLDGGRAARASLWRHRGSMAGATATTATIGRGLGYIVLGASVAGLVDGQIAGLWLAAVAVFMISAATAERTEEEILTLFSGVPVRELMTRPVIAISSTMTVLDAGHAFFLATPHAAFPVVARRGGVVGLLTTEQLERIPDQGLVLAGEVADRDPGLRVDADDDVAELLARPAFARVGRAVVVDEGRRPLGIVSVTDVQRAIRQSRMGVSRGWDGESEVRRGG